MTTPAPAPVAESWTTDNRKHMLLDLHQRDLPLVQLIPLLREAAHPDLPWEQVVAGFEAHERTVAKVNELRAGASAENYPEAGELEAWDDEERRHEAIDRLQDQARDVLYRLASGET